MVAVGSVACTALLTCLCLGVTDTYLKEKDAQEKDRVRHAKELELRLVISAARLGHQTARMGEDWAVVSNRVWQVISTNK